MINPSDYELHKIRTQYMHEQSFEARIARQGQHIPRRKPRWMCNTCRFIGRNLIRLGVRFLNASREDTGPETPVVLQV